MNAVDYTRRLRRVATGSWLGSLAVFLALAGLDILPLDGFLPFWALLAGTIPIVAFVKLNRAVCDSCGGRMKISSGYPRIVYRCQKCRSEIDTGIYSDF
ncbi:MAG: hypothetical protein IH612_04230 [Desulfofustis sp.]|nr:hypothetical protein [Desulfofustis sp.]